MDHVQEHACFYDLLVNYFSCISVITDLVLQCYSAVLVGNIGDLVLVLTFLFRIIKCD